MVHEEPDILRKSPDKDVSARSADIAGEFMLDFCRMALNPWSYIPSWEFPKTKDSA